MALAVDTPLPMQEGIFGEFPVKASTKIYEGGLVMIDTSGWALPLSGACQRFAGVAYRQADNSAGANGDIKVKCRIDDFVIEASVTGAGQGDVGMPVFASDDGTLTKTGATTNTVIGKILHLVSGTICQIMLFPFMRLGLKVPNAAANPPTQTEYNAMLDVLRAAGLINSGTT